MSKLNVVRGVCGALADDLIDYVGSYRQARGVLTALVVAIEQDQLKSLYETVQPWIAAEVARQDSVRAQEPEAHT